MRDDPDLGVKDNAEKSNFMVHPKDGRTVTRCHAATSNHRTVKHRHQCDKPATKGLVLCRLHNRTGASSAFSNGYYVGGALVRSRPLTKLKALGRRTK